MPDNRENIFQNIWVNAFVLGLLFICAYWVPIKGIVHTWIKNGDYSYGFLVPLISAYLFWDMRDRLNSIRFKNTWGVLPILLLFILVSIYGILGSSGNVSRPAIPLLIILFAAFCFGLEMVKQFLLPFSFLIFMIPLPAALDRTIGVFLKSVSSRLGGLVIRLVGLPVNVSGNIIDLGTIQLQVVDACSGLRFVFPLLALGVVYAYFFERIPWKRIVLVISTVPIAVIANVLRIGVTGILTDKYGPGVAEGFFHGFSGWAIFMLAFALLFVVGRILSLFSPKDIIRKEIVKKQDQKANPGQGGKSMSSVAFFTSYALLICVAILTWNTHALPLVEIRGGIGSFPLSFSGWHGRNTYVDPDIISRSGAEEAFNASYINTKNEEVSLYLGYRASAFLENENFFHSPTVCLPASGWKEIKVTKHNITKVPRFGTLTVTEMVVQYLGATNLVYFWFQTKNETTYDKNINRFHLALHAIHKDNTYDLFIRVITPVGVNAKGATITQEELRPAEKRLDCFTRDMTKTLLDFLERKQTERK